MCEGGCGAEPGIAFGGCCNFACAAPRRVNPRKITKSGDAKITRTSNSATGLVARGLPIIAAATLRRKLKPVTGGVVMRVIARRLAAGSLGMLCGLLVLTAAPDPAAAQSSPANKANKTALQQLKSERDYCYGPKSSIFVDWFPVFAGTAEKQKSVTPADMRRMVLVTGDRVEVIGNEVRFTSAAGVVVCYVYVECNWANYPQYREAMTRYKDTAFLRPRPGSNSASPRAAPAATRTSISTPTSTRPARAARWILAQAVGFDARFIIPVAPGGVNVFGGYTFRTYTNEKGQLVLDLHIPTAGNDTFLTYKPDNSHTVFGGVWAFRWSAAM